MSSRCWETSPIGRRSGSSGCRARTGVRKRVPNMSYSYTYVHAEEQTRVFCHLGAGFRYHYPPFLADEAPVSRMQCDTIVEPSGWRGHLDGTSSRRPFLSRASRIAASVLCWSGSRLEVGRRFLRLMASVGLSSLDSLPAKAQP